MKFFGGSSGKVYSSNHIFEFSFGGVVPIFSVEHGFVLFNSWCASLPLVGAIDDWVNYCRVFVASASILFWVFSGRPGKTI